MHRALRALFLFALMLGYVLPENGRSETFCLITFEACECEGFDACPGGEESSDACGEEPEAPLPGPPCCLDLHESRDWFLSDSGRLVSDAMDLGPIDFPEPVAALFPPVDRGKLRPPAPPPPPSGRELYRECERILI